MYTRVGLPPRIKKEGRIVYHVKKGVNGYKDDHPTESEHSEADTLDSANIPMARLHEFSDDTDYEPICLRLRDSWGKDIHHAQEIAALLKEREKYFSGELDQNCYRIGLDGLPVYFPGSNSFPQTKKKETCATSQWATAPTPNRFPQETPRTFRSSGYYATSDHEFQEEETLSNGQSQLECSKPWINGSGDPEDSYSAVHSWVTSSRNAMRANLTPAISKRNVLISQDEDVERERSRTLRATMSSALKNTSKYDPHHFLDKKSSLLRSDMTRCGIKKVGGNGMPQNLESARTLLRQAEGLMRASEKQEMLRFRNEPLGYKQEKRLPKAPRPEMSSAEREAAMMMILEKPLPPSRLDFSHGDGVLLKTFSLLNIDPRPILDLKPKGGGRKGVIVPKMEKLRQNAKIYTESKRSKAHLLTNFYPR